MTNESLTFQYDMACTDCDSVWEAFAWIIQELPVDDDSMIKAVRQTGYAPNGWPTLEVEFGNIDIAKGFTAVYLACPDADDDEVLEYLGLKKFVVI